MTFHDTWAHREEVTGAVDLWIAYPPVDMLKKSGMEKALQAYVDKVGLCVTLTETHFFYTGGREPGWKVGLRNYPRFPSENQALLEHAEKIGNLLADAGDQGSFMIEEHGGCTYWFTRRLNDGASPQTMAECDCPRPEICKRTGCENGRT